MPRDRVRHTRSGTGTAQAVRAGVGGAPRQQIRRHRQGQAAAEHPRRQTLEQGQGRCREGRRRSRGGSAENSGIARGSAGARLRRGHAVAAGVRGIVSVRGNPRPVVSHPGGQAGHGTAAPDGSACLRRRWFWQNRGGHSGGVQGGDGRAAGGRAGADHCFGAATLQHLPRAHG